jgi:hypothetical protein
MNPNIFRRKGVIALLLVILLGVVWMGCSTTVKERQPGQTATAATGEERTEGEGIGKYYFDDVCVPKELNYKANKSFIYETPRFRAGILVFSKWRLDVESLIDFFNYHMEKDNWKLVNSFKGKESVLNFSKPDKTCTIKIIEKWYGSTELEVRVGPVGEKKM